ARLGVQLVEALGERGLLAQLEPKVTPRRAKRFVDRRELAAQAVGAVRREQAQPLGIAGGAERGERPLERLAADDGAVLVVELAEPRVDADREGVRTQEPRAEAVNRRDPRTVEASGEVVAAASVQCGANPRAQLARRLARVRDHEHRL